MPLVLTRLRAGLSGVGILVEAADFLFSQMFGPGLGPTQLHIQCASGSFLRSDAGQA